MGGLLSSPVTQQTQQTQQTVTVESSEVKTTNAETIPVDTILGETSIVTDIAPITESKPENEEVKSAPDVVLERYIEPSGTKVEVAPVEVASSADVVKKHKHKKHKKKTLN